MQTIQSRIIGNSPFTKSTTEGLADFCWTIDCALCANNSLNRVSALRVSYGKGVRPGLDQGALLRCLFAQACAKIPLSDQYVHFERAGSHKVRSVVLVCCHNCRTSTVVEINTVLFYSVTRFRADADACSTINSVVLWFWH